MSSRLRLLVPILALAVGVAACSGGASSSPGASGAPPASPSAAASASAGASPAASASSAPASSPTAICSDAAAFRASVTALTSLKLLQVGTAGVKSAVTNVQSSAQALLVSGKDLILMPVTNLLTAVQGLQATITGMGDQPGLGASIGAITTAIDQIKTAAAQVETVLGTTCPAQ